MCKNEKSNHIVKLEMNDFTHTHTFSHQNVHSASEMLWGLCGQIFSNQTKLLVCIIRLIPFNLVTTMQFEIQFKSEKTNILSIECLWP